jgi:hypothetical protein
MTKTSVLRGRTCRASALQKRGCHRLRRLENGARNGMYASMSTPACNTGWNDEEEVTVVASPRGLAARLLQKEREIALLHSALALAHEQIKLLSPLRS